MAKAGTRLRSQVLELQAEQRRRIGWRYIPAVAVYAIACSILIVWMAWLVSAEAAWMMAGFGGGASLLFLWAAIRTPEAGRLESAAVAEEWVASELHKLRRLGWLSIHNLELHKFDVDHVAIGPGGVVVLETKWSGDVWTNPMPRQRRNYIERAGGQVRRSHQVVDRLLKQHGSPVAVRGSAVVASGYHQPDARIRTDGGVRVVPVHLLGRFLQDLPKVLSSEEISAAHAALQQQVLRSSDQGAQRNSLTSLPRS